MLLAYGSAVELGGFKLISLLVRVTLLRVQLAPALGKSTILVTDT